MVTVGEVVWLVCGTGCMPGGGDVGGVKLEGGCSKSVDSVEDGVLDLDDGGSEEIVLEGEPAEGVNDAG